MSNSPRPAPPRFFHAADPANPDNPHKDNPRYKALWRTMGRQCGTLSAQDVRDAIWRSNELGCYWATSITAYNSKKAATRALRSFMFKQWKQALLQTEAAVFLWLPDRPALVSIIDLCILGNEAAQAAYAWRHFDP